MLAELGMLAGALESAKNLGGMAKSLIGINTNAEVQKVAVELNLQILELVGKLQDARMAEYASHEKLRELENKLRDKEAFHREMENYALMSPWPGSFVYARKYHTPVMQQPHYLCTNCVPKEQKSILQAVKGEQGWVHFRCPACSMSVVTNSQGGVVAEHFFS